MEKTVGLHMLGLTPQISCYNGFIQLIRFTHAHMHAANALLLLLPATISWNLWGPNWCSKRAVGLWAGHLFICSAVWLINGHSSIWGLGLPQLICLVFHIPHISYMLGDMKFDMCGDLDIYHILHTARMQYVKLCMYTYKTESLIAQAASISSASNLQSFWSNWVKPFGVIE